MKSIGIMTDSHCGISQEEAKKLGVWVLAMPFYLDEVCYYEDITITREEFYAKMREGAKVSTSQHSPDAVMKMWDEMLLEYEKILFLPLSSGLSGACATAQMLAQEPEYQGRVLVVDNGRVSVLQHRSILDALELVQEGYSAEEIKEMLEQSREEMIIYVAVNTLEYLKRGGRVTPAAAAIGTILNIKPILKFDVGTLDVFHKCRSFGSARKEMLKAMHRDLETRFQDAYKRGDLCLMAASSAEPEAAAGWVKEVQDEFPDIPVMYDNLSLGLACHIGPDGMGVAWTVKPARLPR